MKGKSVRDTIISTSARLFNKQGYVNTSINQIIEVSKIAKSSLYQHFSSKEDLLMVYLEIKGEKTITSLKEIVKPYKTPRAKMLAIFEYMESSSHQNNLSGYNILNIVYDLPDDAKRIKEEVKKQKDDVRILFTEILAPIHKEELADELYTLFEGALIGNKIYSSSWPIVSARKIVRKIL